MTEQFDHEPERETEDAGPHEGAPTPREEDSPGDASQEVRWQPHSEAAAPDAGEPAPSEPHEDAGEHPDAGLVLPDAVRTGHPVVDEVLDSLAAMEDVPAAEQLPLFEAAHEALRSALDQAGTEPGDDPDTDPTAG